MFDGPGTFGFKKNTQNLSSITFSAICPLQTGPLMKPSIKNRELSNRNWYLDIIGISRVDDAVIWMENLDGQGNFSSDNLISDQISSGESIFAADFDGDGRLDDSTFVDVGDEPGTIAIDVAKMNELARPCNTR